MADIEKKVYSHWAFAENEREKSKVNSEIYQELISKFKISRTSNGINFDDFDLVYDRAAGYAHGEYRIKKNTTGLSDNELALIFDGGNLCFGYKKETDTYFYIFED